MTLTMHLQHGTYQNGNWKGWGVEDTDRHGWKTADEATTSWRTRGVLGKKYLNGRETTGIVIDGKPLIQRIWFTTPTIELVFDLESP